MYLINIFIINFLKDLGTHVVLAGNTKCGYATHWNAIIFISMFMGGATINHKHVAG